MVEHIYEFIDSYVFKWWLSKQMREITKSDNKDLNQYDDFLVGDTNVNIILEICISNEIINLKKILSDSEIVNKLKEAFKPEIVDKYLKKRNE